MGTGFVAGSSLVKKMLCVGALFAALGCLMAVKASSAGNACEAVFPGAVDRLGDAPRACLIEWIPSSAEQEKDFAAHCRAQTGHLYVDFTRENATGRVGCLYRPASGPDQTEDRVAGLPEIVRKWNSSCLNMERTGDDRTTSCWLEAVEAINDYAKDVAFSKLVSELQRAWLQRARDLLTTRSKVVAAPNSTPTVPSASLEGCRFDESLDGVHCRKEQSEVGEETASAYVTPRLKRVLNTSVLPRKKPAHPARAVNLQRKKNFSRMEVARKAKARSVKLAVPSHVPVQIKKLKSTKVYNAANGSASNRAPTVNHAHLIKTSTTSKCFVSAESC
jgi:hypothetical protein